MSVIVDTDSYITVAEATTTLADYFDADNWTNATTANKELALKQATRKIDELYLLGSKYLSTQSLEFPRNFVVQGISDTSSEVNDKVKTAQALEALAILDYRADASQASALDKAKKGITAQAIEGTSVSYDKDYQNTLRNEGDMVIYSKEAKKLLKYWIQTTFSRR